MSGKAPIHPPSGSKSGGQSMTAKAGLIFPCARVRSHMKEVCFGQRIRPEAAICLAGVLEYLVAELLEVSGEEAKRQNRQRITPAHLLDTIRNDVDFSELAKNITLAHTGSSIRSSNPPETASHVVAQETRPDE
ncbi:histone H2A [Gregarina niphandrodes]|uniref:Histone H2A n=1 Tax=Gregarina niphandrodes TaxID=110365 RepID=A0A023B8S8_GRENI|nr:histone H2A [Gregarina niphandrodes]EZG69601.1 histone H2A [Gregarina niphandrodes]|eukprot:XP_011129995.1 histone H2A [Gregarina niphandrodes]